jgi:RNA polymerase sigma-70 factor (ECF subfamily)
MFMGRRGTGHPDTARPDEPTDAELLRRHIAGDTEAFGALFTRHRDRLWAVALRTTCDPEEASDALQDAMISAFRRAGDFRGDSAVTTWLHRIVVNACLDRLRRRAARPATTGQEEVLATLNSQIAADPADGSGLRLDVSAALSMLPVPQRAALVLVDMFGYQVSDAAQILGVSVGTIKSRCARGRAKLAPLLVHLTGNPQAPDDVSPEQEQPDQEPPATEPCERTEGPRVAWTDEGGAPATTEEGRQRVKRAVGERVRKQSEKDR